MKKYKKPKKNRMPKNQAEAEQLVIESLPEASKKLEELRGESIIHHGGFIAIVPMGLRAHIIEVMGLNEMTVEEVVSELQARGWMPESPEPLKHIGLALNAYNDFEAVGSKFKVKALN